MQNLPPEQGQIPGQTQGSDPLSPASATTGFDPLKIGALALSIAPLLVAVIFLLDPPNSLLAIALLAVAGITALAARATLRELGKRIEEAEENRRFAEAMHQQAHTDPVTGVLNRAGFDDRLQVIVGELPADGKLALIWLDMCRFKQLNDALGHLVGDKVLVEVARRIKDRAPADIALCRFASDEFLLAVPVETTGEAQALAAQIGDALDRAFHVNGNRITCGAMIGVALVPDDADNADKLMTAANLALYQARSSGRSEVRFFDDSMTRAVARRKEIEVELRTAIQRDELSIFFQPIIDLDTGKIRKFEALVRWFHTDKGELRPDEFIPVAEESGLIITLGNWITAQAARAASTWPEDVTLALNLSPRQIKAPGAALGILSALREAGLDPARLELEVTESLFLEDDEHIAEFIDGLSQEGVRFSLDDFGTGYSSLNYIQRHPFRTIKVDRSFVSGANSGARSEAIIRAVAEMGSMLDMDVVAEGLETIEQVQAVREAGCTLGQGWYFSRAVPDFTAAMLLAQEREQLHGMGITPARKAS